MRTIVLLLLLVPALAMRQETEPLKRANVIIVKADGSAQDLYKAAGQSLIEQGFTIDKTSPDFFTISTKLRSYIGGRAKIVLDVSTRDNEVKLTGMFQSNVDATPVMVIENRGAKDSPFGASFTAMNNAAKAIAERTNGTLVYLKQ